MTHDPTALDYSTSIQFSKILKDFLAAISSSDDVQLSAYTQAATPAILSAAMSPLEREVVPLSVGNPYDSAISERK